MFSEGAEKTVFEDNAKNREKEERGVRGPHDISRQKVVHRCHLILPELQA